jgi:chromosome segregation ATPase
MSWPLADSHRRHVAAPLQKRRRTPRFVWVLTVAAFLCGGLLSAAGFAIGWKHEAQRGTSAESALVAATASVHTLRTQLAAERTELAAERVRATGLGAARHSAQRKAAKLQAKAAALQQKLASVGAAAGRLSGDLDRLTNELRALTSYVTTTPSGQLDAGYVQAQLSYLGKTVDGFRAAVAALTSP